MIRTCFLLMLTLLAADDDAAKKDRAAMQGDWAADSLMRDGTRADDDSAHSLFRTVKGDAYTTYLFRKKIAGGTFKLDASKTPRQIDITPEGGKGVVIQGIYKIEKGTFTMCYAGPGGKRPTAFESKEGSGVTLIVWKKEKK
jgi:uncharacterized protein (TIGR03067 family)